MTYVGWLTHIIAFMAGGFLGGLVMSLCCVASRADRRSWDG